MPKEKSTGAFTADELAAMKERAAEVKAAKRKSGKADGTADVLAKIDEMTGTDKKLAEKIHEIVTATAPELSPKTWYGMPGYARDGKIVVFFQGAEKFKARYATIGFNDTAALDDGSMWPTAFALTDISPAIEKRIAELVKKAAG